MKIPKGMTEKQVLASIEVVANGLAAKFQFGYYSLDDMKQEARFEALKGLETYDPKKGKLETFLWTHVRNRLFNLKRNKFQRPDKPCLDCPLKAYDPHCKSSYSQCTAFNDKENCELYDGWAKRNDSKKNIMSPIGMSNVQSDRERNMSTEDGVAESIDFSNMVELLDKNMPIPLRRSWLKMKSDIKMPKPERTKLLEGIQDILAEVTYGS